MTAELKTDVHIRTMHAVQGNTLQDGDVAFADQVLFPLNDLLALARNGRIAVSEDDTHVKHLEDAIQGTAGIITVTVVQDGANEYLQINLDLSGIPANSVLITDSSGQLHALPLTRFLLLPENPNT